MLDQQATLNKNGKRQNKFTKFLLKSWQPIPTWQSTIILFLIVGLALIGFGVALIIINRNIVEFSRQYDTDCTQQTCSVQFTISTAMSAPIFFYYEIDNFYQNHRRYINSVSSSQLAGNDISSSTASSDCTPIVTNADMGKNTSVTGAPLVSTDVAVPCGLIAKSVFNDTYKLYDSTLKQITITETGIAWPSDVNTKFKNSSNVAKQWTSMTDEHFIVWMRTAGLPDFRKLWGKINQDLPAGTYILNIQNNYPVSGFNGKKYVVVSTTGPFGGKNNFLSISYLAVGGVCVLVSVFFFIRWRQFAKKTR